MDVKSINKKIDDNIQVKFIAKAYTENGNILYFDDDDKDDGFSDIISDLNNGMETFLLARKNKIRAVWEFIEELKFSVENGKLHLVFTDSKPIEDIYISL
jgi:hypothetical protein